MIVENEKVDEIIDQKLEEAHEEILEAHDIERGDVNVIQQLELRELKEELKEVTKKSIKKRRRTTQ